MFFGRCFANSLTILLNAVMAVCCGIINLDVKLQRHGYQASLTIHRYAGILVRTHTTSSGLPYYY